MDIEKFISIYEKIIESNKDSEEVRLLDEYLKTTDFFTAPASRSYHHSYEGGLLEHCLEIYNYLSKLNGISLGVEIPNDHRFIMAFGHDLSKTNFYVKAKVNKKIAGEWRSIDSYNVEDKLKLPHEIGSLRLIKQLFKIPIEIEKAILYHHGAFNSSTMNEFSDSCKTDPYTFLLHTADMTSCIMNEKFIMQAIRKARGW